MRFITYIGAALLGAACGAAPNTALPADAGSTTTGATSSMPLRDEPMLQEVDLPDQVAPTNQMQMLATFTAGAPSDAGDRNLVLTGFSVTIESGSNSSDPNQVADAADWQPLLSVTADGMLVGQIAYDHTENDNGTASLVYHWVGEIALKTAAHHPVTIAVNADNFGVLKAEDFVFVAMHDPVSFRVEMTSTMLSEDVRMNWSIILSQTP